MRSSLWPSVDNILLSLSFENANGLLMRCITGTTNSIMNMIVSAMCLQNVRLITSNVTHLECRLFIKELLTKEKFEGG